MAAPIPPQDAKKVSELSARARWASIAVRNNLADIQSHITALTDKAPNHGEDIKRSVLAPMPSALGKPEGNDKFKVGIVGAGCAGVFTAMIFDHLKKTYGLDVDYEILEAADESRFGGRLFTYYFDKDKTEHNYYDVGAMRFPEINVMKQTFKLFENLKMDKIPDGTQAKPGQLRTYYLGADPSGKNGGINVPTLYNDIQYVNGKNFTANSFKITTVKPEFADQTSAQLIGSRTEKFTSAYPKTMMPDDLEGIKEYQKQVKAFWDMLMTEGDVHTVRTYLMSHGLDYNTIEWMETLNFGNRWYDQAFSEMILEDLDFNPTAPWWCVEGGSNEILKRMRQRIEEKSQKISFNKRVTEIGYNVPKEEVPKSTATVALQVEGESRQRVYDAVFNSAPLGSMQRMKLQKLYLNWGTKQAIRSLGYGASCKAGIRFKDMWWMKDPYNITQGGVAKTDLPIRACVYPSYNVDDNKDKPGILLCSYTWSQEAQRLGAMINADSPAKEDELKETLIDNLARLHCKQGLKYEDVRHTIESSYETHFAYDWYANPHTTGAFAYFGPGQFQNMYPWIIRNAGKHIIIGEAASAHHAWVVGALESAVRGVYQFLFKHADRSAAAQKALQAYEADGIEQPFGPLPAEMDRTNDVKYPPLDIPDADKPATQVAPPPTVGDLARLQVYFEGLRIAQGGDQLVPEKLSEEDIKPLLQATAAVQAAA